MYNIYYAYIYEHDMEQKRLFIIIIIYYFLYFVQTFISWLNGRT